MRAFPHHRTVPAQSSIAEYYARCEREARAIAAQLLEAMNARAPTAEIRRLERLLEEARNTGD